MQENACEYIADSKAPEELIDAAIALLNDKEKQKILSDNIIKLALPNADEVIAKEVNAISDL
ncbi:MAG: murG [Mucilaginibacter sp.]|nr:murG [Mucilaginibacter sp.]